jgi:hypothetical protein
MYPTIRRSTAIAAFVALWPEIQRAHRSLVLSLDWPLTQFGVFGPASCCTSSFYVFGPVLSSPAHAAASLDMPLRRIEVVFVLWDDLKLTSGLRTLTAFNGQNYFFKIAGSKVLDKYYNSYQKK